MNSSISSILQRYLQPPPNQQRQQNANNAPQLNPIIPIQHSQPQNNPAPYNPGDDSDHQENDDEDVMLPDNEAQPDALLNANQLNYEFGDLNYWSNTLFPWSDRLLACLMQYFEFDSFRPIQKAVMNATLSKRDVFLCIPTSSGKSLTFQLPALLDKGVTVVFMPLIALMQDQAAQLQAKNIPVLNLSGPDGVNAHWKFSSLLKEYREAQQNNISQPSYPRIIFLSPEKIAMSEATFNFLQKIYQLGMIERFVIDEAHCVSMWGHEFRKEYLNLKRLKEDFPGVPTLAMTATATEDYRNDIITELGMQNVLYFQNSFNRENLVFEVRPKDSKDDILQIAQFINSEYPGESGIIYTTCRNDAERVANELRVLHNISTGFYHAKMDDQMRKNTQNAWMNGKINVIVATIAFGMGINKSNVRFVIHYNLAKSLAHYYQEAGRAGRDGQKSHCIVFYNPDDRLMLEFFIATGQGTQESKRDNAWDLYNMIKYCEDLCNCRRVISLGYFGEQFDKANCRGLCDNCQANQQSNMRDITVQVQKIIRYLQRPKRGGYNMEELPRRLLGIGKKFEGNRVLEDSVNKEEVAAIIKELITKKIIFMEHRIVHGKRRDSFKALVEVNEDKIGPILAGTERFLMHFPVYNFRRVLRASAGHKERRRAIRNQNLQSQMNSQFYGDDNDNRGRGDDDDNNDDDNNNGGGGDDYFSRMNGPGILISSQFNDSQSNSRVVQERQANENSNSILYREYVPNQYHQLSQQRQEEQENREDGERSYVPMNRDNNSRDSGELYLQPIQNDENSAPNFLTLLSQFDTTRQNRFKKDNAIASSQRQDCMPLSQFSQVSSLSQQNLPGARNRVNLWDEEDSENHNDPESELYRRRPANNGLTSYSKVEKKVKYN